VASLVPSFTTRPVGAMPPLPARGRSLQSHISPLCLRSRPISALHAQVRSDMGCRVKTAACRVDTFISSYKKGSELVRTMRQRHEDVGNESRLLLHFPHPGANVLGQVFELRDGVAADWKCDHPSESTSREDHLLRDPLRIPEAYLASAQRETGAIHILLTAAFDLTQSLRL
jgi:hypothetical protein